MTETTQAIRQRQDWQDCDNPPTQSDRASPEWQVISCRTENDVEVAIWIGPRRRLIREMTCGSVKAWAEWK